MVDKIWYNMEELIGGSEERGINRNILECKEKRRGVCVTHTGGINRNILECKVILCPAQRAGFFSIILSELGHTVHGIDITPNMIEEAKQLAQSLDSDATFSVMDAENLSFDTNTFDIVVARNVTWNLPHPDKAYAEWLRIIRPGGLILNYDAEHARNHHDLPQSVHHAHEHVSSELKERCHTIYHMLEISSFTRPQWDKEVLTKLGASSVNIDSTVGTRIYSEEDEFYIPVPMFLVKVIK